MPALEGERMPTGFVVEEIPTNSTTASTANAGSLQSLLAWSGYWCCAWIGTTIAGGIFGLILGIFTGATGGDGPMAGLLFGLCWAGGIGLVVISHIAIAFWMLWFNRSDPGFAGAFAGGLVGAICGIIFIPITAPMGWVGAYCACKSYTRTRLGQLVTTTDTEPWQFSMRDLFLRITVVAMLLAFWIGTTQYDRRQTPQFQFVENTGEAQYSE